MENNESKKELKFHILLSAMLLILYFLPVAAVANLLPDGTTGPEFVGHIDNVTVVKDRDATFSCNVRNLKKFRVGWVKADSKAIQSIHDTVITHNSRVEVSGDWRTSFNLHIRKVSEEDRGQYMCQINTDPMTFQTATLDVLIPPDIDSSRTTGDVEIKAGGTATLECHADGYPKPKIKWVRDDQKPIKAKDHSNGAVKLWTKSYIGSQLTIPNVQPDDMGNFLCIASNRVPPTVSKRVYLYVQFPPKIRTREQVVGAVEGHPVKIQCEVEAYPQAIIYWQRNGNIVVTGGAFEVTESEKSPSEITSTLKIRHSAEHLMGKYECVVKNSLGVAESHVILYLIEPPPFITPDYGNVELKTLEEIQSHGNNNKKGHNKKNNNNRNKKKHRQRKKQQNNDNNNEIDTNLPTTTYTELGEEEHYWEIGRNSAENNEGRKFFAENESHISAADNCLTTFLLFHVFFALLVVRIF